MKRNKQLETQSKSGSNLNLLICIATVESPYVTEALGGIQFNAARPIVVPRHHICSEGQGQEGDRAEGRFAHSSR